MGRTAKPLDPHGGPVARFALDLRELRRQAGDPTYGSMARRCGLSKSALAAAAGGERLPSERVLDAYVAVCGGDVETWRTRLREATAEAAGGVVAVRRDAVPARTGPAGDVVDADIVPDPADTEPPRAGAGVDATAPVPGAGRPDDIVDAEVVEDAWWRRAGRHLRGRAAVYVATVALLIAAAGVWAAFQRPTTGPSDAAPATTMPSAVSLSPSSLASAGPSVSAPTPTVTGSAAARRTPTAGAVPRGPVASHDPTPTDDCGGSRPGWGCQGKDPFDTNCHDDMYIADSGTTDAGQLLVYYSKACGTNWAVITLKPGWAGRVAIDNASGFHTCYPADCTGTEKETIGCRFLGGQLCQWTDMAYGANIRATGTGVWRAANGGEIHKQVTPRVY